MNADKHLQRALYGVWALMLILAGAVLMSILIRVALTATDLSGVPAVVAVPLAVAVPITVYALGCIIEVWRDE